MGARTEGIASLLARLGEALAVNPTQQAVAGVATGAIGAVSQARGFNRGQEQTSGRLLATLNEPRPGALQGGPGVNPLSIPGAPGTPPPATFESAGIAPPQRIDPFRAIALGQQGTQNLIRQRQQDKFLVQRQLDQQEDFKNRLKVLKQNQQLRKELAEFEFEMEAARDVERGGPERRRGEAEARAINLSGLRREEVTRPTVRQEFETTAAQLREDLANATTAESKARVSGQLADLELQKAQREGVPTPSVLASTRALAERAMSPIILSTLRERLGTSPEMKKIDAAFNDPATLSDETARRANFVTMVSLLTPNEKEDLEKQFGIGLTEIGAGRQPFGELGFGGLLGTDLAQPLEPIEPPFPPSATNPAIDPVGAASIADAVAGARSANSLLRRSGR